MIITFIQRAIMQSIPLLFGSTGETITEKGGNLNLGIPGIMYVGGISGVICAFFYEKSVETVNPFLAVLIPLLSSILGSALMGLLYCFLTVTLRANQNVTGLAMTTFGVGFGNFFGRYLVAFLILLHDGTNTLNHGSSFPLSLSSPAQALTLHNRYYSTGIE